MSYCSGSDPLGASFIMVSDVILVEGASERITPLFLHGQMHLRRRVRDTVSRKDQSLNSLGMNFLSLVCPEWMIQCLFIALEAR